MKRRSPLLIALIALTLVAAGSPGLPHVELANGRVEIGTGTPPAWRLARAGELLRPGDWIRVGEGGRAELRLGEAIVRLYERSLLRLPADAFGSTGSARAVRLDEGTSLFEIEKRQPGEGFEVRTREAVVMVKGTRFSVQTGGGSDQVSVFRGLVGVRDLATPIAHEILVRPGFSAVRGLDRAFELSLDQRPDPWAGFERGEKIAPLAKPTKAALSHRAAAAEARLLANAAVRRALTGDLHGRARARGPTIRAYAREQRGLSPDRRVEARDARRERGIRERLAGAVLNANTSGSPGVTALRVSVITSGGPNRIELTDSAGSIVDQMTKGQIQSVIQTGNAGLLDPGLVQNLLASGVDPIVYMQILADML